MLVDFISILLVSRRDLVLQLYSTYNNNNNIN